MHKIRLRAAWRSDGAAHTRRFNTPTGLDDGERVWLAIDAPSMVQSATLNGATLEFSSAGRCDVTGSLRPSNELVVRTDDASLLETVRLEIEALPKS